MLAVTAVSMLTQNVVPLHGGAGGAVRLDAGVLLGYFGGGTAVFTDIPAVHPAI